MLPGEIFLAARRDAASHAATGASCLRPHLRGPHVPLVAGSADNHVQHALKPWMRVRRLLRSRLAPSTADRAAADTAAAAAGSAAAGTATDAEAASVPTAT